MNISFQLEHCSDITLVPWLLKAPATGLPFWAAIQYSSFALLTLCEGNPPVTSGFPSQRSIIPKTFPCHDVIMIFAMCGYGDNRRSISGSSPSKVCTLHCECHLGCDVRVSIVQLPFCSILIDNWLPRSGTFTGRVILQFRAPPREGVTRQGYGYHRRGTGAHGGRGAVGGRGVWGWTAGEDSYRGMIAL